MPFHIQIEHFNEAGKVRAVSLVEKAWHIKGLLLSLNGGEDGEKRAKTRKRVFSFLFSSFVSCSFFLHQQPSR